MQDKTTSSTQTNSGNPGGWTAMRRISAWYWGAIGVIALAALAQFFQAAPVTTPATVVSAALAPGVTLQIAYPRDVRPVLREADKAPLALTLQGTGALTYTVALSTNAPLLFTDKSLQVVDPHAELVVNDCCQSSVIFYPQASTAAWHLAPVEVSAYAASAGAPLPAAPTLSFTLYLEPVWWTWGRRILLLFAELGLAVSVALALGGWALERQRKVDEQRAERDREQREDERQRRQLEAKNQEALWQSRLEHTQKVADHDLLAGVSQLLNLQRALGAGSEDNRRRTVLDTVLQSYRNIAADPNSLTLERCLEHLASRLLVGGTFSDDELRALAFLFDGEATGQGDKAVHTLVDRLGKRNATTGAEELLRTMLELYTKFEYSLAIRNLTIELINEWYAKIQNNSNAVNIDEALMPMAHLMSDPRLAQIRFQRRTHLYQLPAVTTYQYPWAHPDNVAAITSRLKTMLKVELRGLADVPATSTSPRLPSPGFVRQPQILKFSVHEDADCAMHLLYAHLNNEARQGLQRIDGAQHKDADIVSNESTGKPSLHDFVPFPISVALRIGAPEPGQHPLHQLMPLANAIGEEWLALLACAPSLWGSFSLAQRRMLAALLQLVAHNTEEMQYRLLQQRQSNRCQQQANLVNARRSDSRVARQDDDGIIKKLAESIATHWQYATHADKLEASHLETLLTLRPHYFSHTVVIALVHPAAAATNLIEWWLSWFHLANRLRTRGVIVHFLTAHLPDAPLLQRLAVDGTVSRMHLAELLDDAFAIKALKTEQRTIHDANAEGCRIAAISRLLDANSLDLVQDVTDALLDNANGSPSRLLHMIYLMLKHRLANLQENETEFKLNHLDMMSVVQTYPKER